METEKKKKILVFDLDGCLVVTSNFLPLLEYDFDIPFTWEGFKSKSKTKVKIRPGAFEAIEKFSKKYHVVVFSHSNENYINAILEKMEIVPLISMVFSGKDELSGMKDLSVVLKKLGYNGENDKSEILLIDDNDWVSQNENLVLVDSFSANSDNSFWEELESRILEKFSKLSS